ncbi:hypothetical protein G7Y89_g8301 [Cudoniella acicularis]|uniref:Uncharacterized protein n=1 Tax=Cudoniella acicularis TaxID=354080 RepID=A0A8H4W0Q5_9HELO|nr:hypothetical protein G7Y89_g8301 [Cudoniella acicularis]
MGSPGETLREEARNIDEKRKHPRNIDIGTYLASLRVPATQHPGTNICIHVFLLIGLCPWQLIWFVAPGTSAVVFNIVPIIQASLRLASVTLRSSSYRSVSSHPLLAMVHKREEYVSAWLRMRSAVGKYRIDRYGCSGWNTSRESEILGGLVLIIPKTLHRQPQACQHNTTVKNSSLALYA